MAEQPATPSVPILASCPPPPRVAVSRRRSFTPPPPPVDDVPVTAVLPRPRGWRLLTPEPQPLPIMPDDQLNRWRASEQRLWKIAGSLMALALVVVGALALLTFGPSAGSIPVAPAAAAGATAANAPHANAGATHAGGANASHANNSNARSNGAATVAAAASASAQAKTSAHHRKTKRARGRKLARQ